MLSNTVHLLPTMLSTVCHVTRYPFTNKALRPSEFVPVIKKRLRYRVSFQGVTKYDFMDVNERIVGNSRHQ